MKLISSCFLLAFALVFTCQAQSQNDIRECSNVLVKTTQVKNHSRSMALAILKLVNESNFSEFKNTWGGSVTIPIEGIPVTPSTDYDSFDSKRREILQREQYSLDEAEASNEMVSCLPKELADNWVKCIEITAKKPENDGIHCWTTEFDVEAITVQCYWNTPPDGRPSGIQHQELTGGSAVDSSVPRNKLFPDNFVFGVNSKKTRTIKRDSSAAIRLRASCKIKQMAHYCLLEG